MTSDSCPVWACTQSVVWRAWPAKLLSTRAGFRLGSISRLASGEGPLLPRHPRRQAVRISHRVLCSLGLMLPLGWCGSPVCRAALELLPVAAVRVLGVLAGHPLGKFGVERVGEVGDVA